MVLLKLFKRNKKSCRKSVTSDVGKEVVGMNADFMNGILFEENPFADEIPDNVVVYDLNGEEIKEG